MQAGGRAGAVRGVALLAGVLAAAGAVRAQERLPQQIAGTWRITRVLPQRAGGACWSEKEAGALVGTTLAYSAHAMRWKGGAVPLAGVTTRVVTASDVEQEAIDPSQTSGDLRLADLGISGTRTLEINLQHEDMDITGSTTEVPGDSVLVAGPGRIVVSACGVYMEARRTVGRAMVSGVSGAPGPSRKGL